jgi:hypothetical protein
MASPNRTGGGGLSMQTLVVASAASLAAALITSRLFPPGAVFTAALTPVIVTMISEALHRPVNRVTELRQSRRTMVREGELLRSARPGGDVPMERGAWTDPVPGESDPFGLREPPEPSYGNGNGSGAGGMSAHGRSRWGRIHPRVAIATGLLAFAIAAATLTLPELIFGGAVASGKRTTLVPVAAKSKPKKADQPKQQTDTTPKQTGTETTPAQEAPQTTTETTPTETTPTQPAPSGGAPAAPAPTPTPTETTPSQTAPSG